MNLYINGIGCISPQRTFGPAEFLTEIKECTTNRMVCVDADYTKYFDAGSIRRMGRLMRYGTAAGLIALDDAGIKTPGAISTGTGWGLPEVSQKFLRSLIEVDETIVSPTTFIQSTHNTVSSNIALLRTCYAHNNTFSHKGFSFESALMDAQLLAAENMDNILVGAYDEVSDYKYAAMKKTKELRELPCSSSDVYGEQSNGIIAGEGAAFFVLGKTATEKTYGVFTGSETFFKPTEKEIAERITGFLAKHHLQLKDVDVVISGINGEKETDEVRIATNKNLFAASTVTAFKHLCGEYMTASAFAFWLAAQMLKTQRVPAEIILEDRARAPKIVLLYNSFKAYHSVMLFKSLV